MELYIYICNEQWHIYLKLPGIAQKLLKMLRKHPKFRQGEKVRISDVFILLFFKPE